MITISISPTNFVASNGKLDTNKGYFLASSNGPIYLPIGNPIQSFPNPYDQKYNAEFRVAFGNLDFNSPSWIASGGGSSVTPSKSYEDTQ